MTTHMTEHIQEQLSAFVDDELSSEECAFLVRRLSGDPSARAQLTRYVAIGSVLRCEPVVANSSMLRDRVRAALDGVTDAPARRAMPAPRPSRRWAYSVAGAGIAASVAVVALLGLRTVLSGGTGVATTQAGLGTRGSQPTVSPSYVVPADTSEARAYSPPIRLTNYLVHHGNYTSTLQRTSVNSNVVGNSTPESTTAQLPDATSSER